MHIFKNYFKISLILLLISQAIISYVDIMLLPAMIIGFLVSIISFILNYKGSFLFLARSKDTFSFFVTLSFFARIIFVIVVGVIITLKSSNYLIPYIVGYSLNLISIVYIAMKRKEGFK